MSRYPKNSTPKLTKEIIADLASIIRTGSYVETAVAYCGISKDTFYRWLKEARGKKASALHLELSDALRSAFAESELRDLLVIQKAAIGTPARFVLNEDGTVKVDEFGIEEVAEYKILPDWKAAAWRIDRRRTDNFAKDSLLNGPNEEEEKFEIEFIDSSEQNI